MLIKKGALYINKLDDVIDKCVIITNGVMMYKSCK